MSSEQGGKEPKRQKETNDVPHICLKCGAELTRGRDYYKKRHWDQAHKDEKADMYLQMIVRKDHEKARNFIIQKKEQSKMKSTPKRLMTALEGCASTTPSKTPTSSTSTCQPSETASHQKRRLQDDHSATSPISVQQSMENFITVKEKQQPDPLENIQSGVNQILVKLGSLTVNESNSITFGVNCDVTILKTISNLTEVKHPDICVETLDDGCRITCLACKNYAKSQPTTKVYVKYYHI